MIPLLWWNGLLVLAAFRGRCASRNSKDFIEGSWMVLVAQDMDKRIVTF